jgi:hypothetical protein
MSSNFPLALWREFTISPRRKDNSLYWNKIGDGDESPTVHLQAVDGKRRRKMADISPAELQPTGWTLAERHCNRAP